MICPCCGQKIRESKYKECTKEDILRIIIASDYFKKHKYNIDLISACQQIKGIPSHKIAGKILGVDRNNRLSNIIKEYLENKF